MAKNREFWKEWPLYDEIPEGWRIDKTAGSPVPMTVFITDGKSVLHGQKRALLRVKPKEQETKVPPVPAAAEPQEGEQPRVRANKAAMPQLELNFSDETQGHGYAHSYIATVYRCMPGGKLWRQMSLHRDLHYSYPPIESLPHENRLFTYHRCDTIAEIRAHFEKVADRPDMYHMVYTRIEEDWLADAGLLI